MFSRPLHEIKWRRGNLLCEPQICRSHLSQCSFVFQNNAVIKEWIWSLSFLSTLDFARAAVGSKSQSTSWCTSGFTGNCPDIFIVAFGSYLFFSPNNPLPQNGFLKMKMPAQIPNFVQNTNHNSWQWNHSMKGWNLWKITIVQTTVTPYPEYRAMVNGYFWNKANPGGGYTATTNKVKESITCHSTLVLCCHEGNLNRNHWTGTICAWFKNQTLAFGVWDLCFRGDGLVSLASCCCAVSTKH